MSDIIERFGAFLLKAELITEPNYADSIELHRLTGLPLSRCLVELTNINSAVLIAKLAEQIGIPFVDISDVKIDANAIATIPEEICRKYLVLPLDFDDAKLVVAMASPDNIVAGDDLKMITGYEIIPVIATKEDIEANISRYHQLAETLTDDDLNPDEDLSELTGFTEEAPIVKLVNVIISQGVESRASDIHVEPMEKDLRIRYRIDGVLQEIMRSPKHVQSAIISRLKIMAGMDIAESRKPQDGRCALTIRGRGVDFRVATLPTVYGERVVLRVLEKDSIMLDLNDLGFMPDSLSRFKKSYTRPYGAILVTGPTGSGKSTTLYATLNTVNDDRKNIITVEDPVEYRLPGINQVQINTKAGLTFARGLRAILRASPDIIMIGEIRDKETAQIAVEAALTGHLVLSTLHTNDAPSAISRLTEMGIAPFLISSAVACVQAQRLARRLCPECKEEYQPPLAALKNAGFPVSGKEAPVLYRPVGCSKCDNTGFRGRVGLYEIMLMSEKIEQLTVDRASADEIRKVAIEEGLKTLKDDGFAKVKMGLTSIEEIMRVVV